MPIWLNEADVRAVLPPGELTGAIESALAAFSAGRVDQAVGTALQVGGRSYFGLMPAFDPAQALLGAELVTVMPENVRRGLPTHMAAIALFDPKPASPSFTSRAVTRWRAVGLPCANICAENGYGEINRHDE